MTVCAVGGELIVEERCWRGRGGLKEEGEHTIVVRWDSEVGGLVVKMVWVAMFWIGGGEKMEGCWCW